MYLYFKLKLSATYGCQEGDCCLHLRTVTDSGNQMDMWGSQYSQHHVSRDNLAFTLSDVHVPLASSRIIDFGQDHVIHIPQDLDMSILHSITHVLRICFNSELSLHLPASC